MVTEETATAHPTLTAVASALVIDVATLDDGGFWRLISHSYQLNLTLGQLQDHGAPESVTADGTDGLATLDASLTSLPGSVSSGDSAAIEAAIEVSRGEVNALRRIVDRAA